VDLKGGTIFDFRNAGEKLLDSINSGSELLIK
jgi:hypothetical protein